MRVGVISDIHGNIVALEKIVDYFNKNRVDQILCGGDVIGIGPHPEEVVQCLKTLSHFTMVRGNHEGYLLEGIPEILHGRPIREIEREHDLWVHNRLSSDSIAFLKSFSKEISITIQDKKIYMTHYPMEQNEEYKTFYKVATDDQLVELFSQVEADVCLYGHTHVGNQLNHEGKWLINMGSVGCPIKEDYLHAGILTMEDAIFYEPVRLLYDAQGVREDIKKIAYPFHEELLRVFF